MSRSTYADLAGGDTRVHHCLSDEAFLGGLVDFEKAVAKAACQVGLIDSSGLEQALHVIEDFDLKLEDLSRSAISGANPVIPLVKELKAKSPQGIHVGATSQDAIDSSLMLVMRKAIRQLLVLVDENLELLKTLALTHRNSPVIGHTLGQQATPTTFGLCAALWWQQLQEARRDLDALVFPVQFAGATGTLAAVYPHGMKMHEIIAEELGLVSRPMVWHTDRTPMLKIANSLCETAIAANKIATDLIAFSATEIAEVQEANPGGSSAMPHKANPAAAIAARGYALQAPGYLNMLTTCAVHLQQRAIGEWHAEWRSIRELAACAGSAQARINAALSGLQVYTETMSRNLKQAETGKQSVGHAAELVDTILRGDCYD
ncbi:3-carboxy-cis,cis-muconate cycloisomerase [Corynebacterium poyangense]|uniref:3-carboxy-cis,cis-muconate cycloisomerase n=1 Tax=Corynebacterium poyangense TaxID=2684405 RepID=A0A7H0SQJ3_9CORY|nr:lyase family protein [Corynebacterium poyangense]MBZ8178291.1 3-carboxy-cis,cis-muconate cycloisomerase [Corynebacterium poyangense]QNQ90818.1 3-carboxy-cis,cis-muconate cycloisomerase [Corynebacterium poyangense]